MQAGSTQCIEGEIASIDRGRLGLKSLRVAGWLAGGRGSYIYGRCLVHAGRSNLQRTYLSSFAVALE